MSTRSHESEALPSTTEILQEFGPFPDATHAHGVTFDGRLVWFASGTRLTSFDPRTGEPGRDLAVACDAGTTFDGRHLYQIADARILKIDPENGEVVSSIPAPGKGGDSGLTWAEGTLWVGQHRDRKILQVDPETGAVLRTLDSDRFVTGVTWLDGELWHGTWEGEQSELRKVDSTTGEVLERAAMPQGTHVSGLESDGNDTFFCGSGPSGKVRAVRCPQT